MASLSNAQRALLEGNAWFASLPSVLRDAIIAVAHVDSFAAGQRVYSKGGSAEGWYCLLSGALKISSTSAKGRESVLAFLEPGVWFGEISLLDGEPRTHDGIAQVSGDMVVVRPADFAALLVAFPELPVHLLRLQSARLRRMFAAMEELNQLPLEARLARQLLSLARSYGTKDASGTRINLRLPQEDLAQLLGASRQRVNTELSAWARSGWIRLRYGDITLLDVQALAGLARQDRR